MTVSQVADRLGVCRSTVYQLCERGEIRHVRVSNAIRVSVEALAEYVGRSSKKEPVAEGGIDLRVAVLPALSSGGRAKTGE